MRRSYIPEEQAIVARKSVLDYFRAYSPGACVLDSAIRENLFIAVLKNSFVGYAAFPAWVVTREALNDIVSFEDYILLIVIE